MLIVANGHHWDARWPEPAFLGAETFEGRQLHAHDYRDNRFLEGKDVVVLGMGNSAMDIAVESSYVAASTQLAARRGAWIVPKYLFGRPSDTLTPSRHMPVCARRQALLAARCALHNGPPERYGLQRPEHPPAPGAPDGLRAHPRPHHPRLGHAAPEHRAARARLGALRRRHAGARRRRHLLHRLPDQLPVLSTTTSSRRRDNHIALFQRVFAPAHPNLAFVGLIQPIGATMPIAEAQGRLLAAYLRGEYHLPPRARMLAAIRRADAAVRRRYVASQRHTIQVDFDRYMHDLERERRRGARRAARGRLRPGAAGPRRGRGRRGADGRVSVAADSAPGRREATKLANRAAIITAARCVFAEMGYGSATVRDVVRRTDLASGTFYNYFPDKESLFRAVLEESAVEIRARVRAARREATSLEEFVAAGYREYFGFLASDPQAFELMRRNSGTIRAMFDEPIFGAGVDELAADLRAAIALGIVPELDAEYMAAAMVGAALEVGVTMVRREPPDVEGATRFATSVLLGGIERLGREAG